MADHLNPIYLKPWVCFTQNDKSAYLFHNQFKKEIRLSLGQEVRVFKVTYKMNTVRTYEYLYTVYVTDYDWIRLCENKYEEDRTSASS